MKRFNWGTGIFIFFVIFLLLGFTFIAFSFKQNNDLVTDNYYEEGADYSTQIEINKRSYQYTDSLVVSVTKEEILLTFSEGVAASIDSLNLHFYYPKGKESDVHLRYDKLKNPVALNKFKLTAGRSIIKVSWFMKGEKYYLEKMIYID